MRKTLGLLIVGGALAAPLGWAISDRLEQNNAFCVACHLDPERPLHQLKSADFASRPAVNLASLHREAEADFRCIDCHGGASFLNKARVKLVAARDGLKWALGAFAEPERMAHPLWDEDCRQCHSSYESERDDDFHATSDHNIVDFAFRCVSCHQAHPTRGVSADFAFLDRDVVLPVCHQCHEEF